MGLRHPVEAIHRAISRIYANISRIDSISRIYANISRIYSIPRIYANISKRQYVELYREYTRMYREYTLDILRMLRQSTPPCRHPTRGFG